MKKVWEFFENLDEYVYVTDVKTNELIYICLLYTSRCV